MPESFDKKSEGSGALLRQRRNELGLTQDQLARHFGVTTRTLARWESGETEPQSEAQKVALEDFLQASGPAAVSTGVAGLAGAAATSSALAALGGKASGSPRGGFPAGVLFSAFSPAALGIKASGFRGAATGAVVGAAVGTTVGAVAKEVAEIKATIEALQKRLLALDPADDEKTSK